jgi:hypothetical protein
MLTCKAYAHHDIGSVLQEQARFPATLIRRLDTT